MDGLLRPMIVRRLEDGNSCATVAGERRFRTFQPLGRTTIAALLSEGAADELALTENVQGQDLRPPGRAETPHRLMGRHGYSHGRWYS